MSVLHAEALPDWQLRSGWTAVQICGDTKVVMLLTWFSTYAIRLPAAWFFSGVDIPLWNGMVIPNPGPDWGLVGVWVGL